MKSKSEASGNQSENDCRKVLHGVKNKLVKCVKWQNLYSGQAGDEGAGS